jgi:hypothetical protein
MRKVVPCLGDLDPKSIGRVYTAFCSHPLAIWFPKKLWSQEVQERSDKLKFQISRQRSRKMKSEKSSIKLCELWGSAPGCTCIWAKEHAKGSDNWSYTIPLSRSEKGHGWYMGQSEAAWQILQNLNWYWWKRSYSQTNKQTNKTETFSILTRPKSHNNNQNVRDTNPN